MMKTFIITKTNMDGKKLLSKSKPMSFDDAVEELQLHHISDSLDVENISDIHCDAYHYSYGDYNIEVAINNA